ncbi:MAG: hypothetical protein LBD97_03905 [Bifidobacteriaceae bacterium]|jgi:uncharacterized membrane protein YphA (DoxX/SURF4 family)|nr:hypothetical protein [Bifidobacteriaceae bacterium]
MSMIRVTARALVGAAAIVDGVDALRHPVPWEAAAQPLAAKFSKATGRPADASRWARGAAVALSAGGGLIASSVAPRLGALACVAASLTRTVSGNHFWQVKDDADQRDAERAAFFARLAVLGAYLLILAGPARRSGARTGRRKVARRRGDAE